MPTGGSIVTLASLVTYPVAFGIVKGGFEVAKVLGDWGKSPFVVVVLALFVSGALVVFGETPVSGGRAKKISAAAFLVIANTIVLAAAAFGVGPAAEGAADRLP